MAYNNVYLLGFVDVCIEDRHLTIFRLSLLSHQGRDTGTGFHLNSNPLITKRGLKLVFI
jgi:hypothetical protein